MFALAALLEALQAIAPLDDAGSWDNVGLLVAGQRPISTVGLCIDLTEPVLDELEAAGVDLVLAYHPPIFKGIQRLTGATGIERVTLRLVRAGLHLYAPHTSLDAAVGGMGDWLMRAVAEPEDVLEGFIPIEASPRRPGAGMGRYAALKQPRRLDDLLPRIRQHLGLGHLRVAGPGDLAVRTVAVCPGSGGSVFSAGPPADLLLTGEMGHHDILAQVARGGAVVLTEHSNCERGYLPVLAARLKAALPGLATHISTCDADPLRLG